MTATPYLFSTIVSFPHEAANLPYFAAVRLHRSKQEPDNPACWGVSGKLSEVCLALEQLSAHPTSAK